MLRRAILGAVILVGILVIGASARGLNCPNMVIQNNGAKVCYYNYSYSASYAYKNYDQNNQVKFAKYPNNCTNFISQSIMAGFANTTSMITLYDKRRQYNADFGESYSWYYEDITHKGNTWAEAHSLYLYAKYTNIAESKLPYTENGPKFKYVTNDTLTTFMDYIKVKKGDIIFMDYKDKYENYNPDGKMDHSLIVTGIETWRLGYNEIRVASNSNDYKSDGLGDVNEKYNYNALFYVYRPVAYVDLD